MNLSAWTNSAPPWFHLLVATPAEASDWLRTIADDSKHKVATRLIRGHRAATKPHLLDELAAALQFPPYFGDNWDALHDCLADLSWIPANALIVCLSDADHLLAKAPADLKTLIGVFQSAAKEWNQPETPKPSRALHIVLQVAPGHEAGVRSAWRAAGVELQTVPPLA